MALALDGRSRRSVGYQPICCDRLKEYADFHFSRGEAQIYQWIEEENPELFAEIRNFIRQGRWHVVNGMVIQPDMNIPQGESFVRQVLVGESLYAGAFGRGAAHRLLCR